MKLSESAARAMVRAASAILPPRERPVMKEAWAADLEFSSELDMSPASIGIGAMVYALRRLACLNRSKRSTAAGWYLLAALVVGLIITPWMIPPAIVLGTILWLVAVPAPEAPGGGAGSAPGHESAEDFLPDGYR